MTNLLATIIVTLVTNVSTITNERGCSTCDMIRRNPGIAIFHEHHYGMYEPYQEANEKITKIEIKRLTKCQFEWNGKSREILDEELISSTSETLKKVEQWTSQGLKTNDVAAIGSLTNEGTVRFLTLTNGVWFGFVTNRFVPN